MCAAPHLRLRERGRLDGYAQIIAHRGHKQGGNRDNSEVQRGGQDCRKKNGQRSQERTKGRRDQRNEEQQKRKARLELRAHTHS